jgi:hypothetical protein
MECPTEGQEKQHAATSDDADEVMAILSDGTSSEDEDDFEDDDDAIIKDTNVTEAGASSGSAVGYDNDEESTMEDGVWEPAFQAPVSPVHKKPKARPGGGGGSNPKGRKIGSKTTVFSAVRTFPATDEGKSNAVDAATQHGTNDYSSSAGSLASMGSSRTWRCISHVDCEKKVRVMNRGMQGFELLESAGEHTGQRAVLPTSFQGVSAEFRGRVLELIRLGSTPTNIHATLLTDCGADEAKKARLPTLQKIRALSIRKVATGEFQFATQVDMLNACQDHLIETKGDFDLIENLDKLIVLRHFKVVVHVKDDTPGAPAGTTKSVTSLGFVFSSKRILLQFKQAILDAKNAGQPLGLDADGTYRLFKQHGRTWPMINCGVPVSYLCGSTGQFMWIKMNERMNERANE